MNVKGMFLKKNKLTLTEEIMQIEKIERGEKDKESILFVKEKKNR